ncbi:hypothetical protein SB912_33540, partial [Pantoea sp. SIMBA_072]
VICADAFKTSDYHAMLLGLVPGLSTGQPGALICERFPELRGVVSLAAAPPSGFLAWHELQARADAISREALTERQAQLR